METPTAYLPIDRSLALAHGRALRERTWGAALFADISGFTPLTEKLARALGPKRGAEELTATLNRVYEALMTEVHRFGGAGLGFSGDAITCWFDEAEAGAPEGPPERAEPMDLAGAARRAAACGLAMQAAMRQFATVRIPGGGEESLAVKIGLASGPARRFVVGDPEQLRLDVIAGALFDRLAAAEHQAERGEVIADAATVDLLGAAAQVTAWRQEAETQTRFAVLGALTGPAPERPWPPAPALSADLARSWLLPPVFRRLQAGQGAFLAELRPAAALFMRFTGIDYDGDPAAPAQLDALIRQVTRLLSRYDGSLLQLTIGDKGSYLYAAFGAPVAHEDDAQRAAAAALALKALPEQLAFLPAVQIGLTHGRMRAGAYGSEARRTYGVLGDAVNLAARLMQLAGPGQVLVDEEAQVRARDDFAWEALPPLRVKGKDLPINVFRLLAHHTRDARQALEALYPEPPLGQAAPLAALGTALAEVRTGAGRVVRLTGEAGLGKSHLLAEWLRQAGEVRLALGTCQSLTQNTLYHPWRQIFSSLLGVEGLAPAAAVAHLTDWLAREHPAWALRLPVLGDVLGLPIPDNATTAALDASLRQQTLFSLLVDLVRAWAGAAPVWLVVENAHWLDEASQALAQALAQQATAASPVGVLLVHRPAWLGDAALLPALADLPGYVEVRPAPLSPAEVGALIERRLGGPASALLRDVVQAMAHGNPFFIGELLAAMRSAGQLAHDDLHAQWRPADELIQRLHQAGFLIQREGEWALRPEANLGAVPLGVPDSIHGLILSRLDRLPEAHQLTLKVSSVVGHYIDLALVAEAHPEDKDVATIQDEARDMEAEEVIHEEMPSRRIFAFRHHTTQEVAYETLLHAQRQQLHRAVAEALVAQQPEAVTQIAHHAFLGELWPLALVYNERAGAQAQQLYANRQGLAFYQRALTSALALPEAETAAARQRVYLALGELSVHTDQHPAAREHLAAALALAEAAGDWEAQARSCRWMGRSHELRGEAAPARSWLTRGLALLAGPRSVEEAELCLNLALLDIRQGEYAEAVAMCERSLKVAEALDDNTVRARAYNTLGVVDRRRGDGQAAVARFEQSLAQYDQLQNVYGQAISHNLIANGYFMAGAWGRAQAHYRRALELFERLGSGYNQVLVNNNLGGVALKQGDYAGAEGAYQQALRLLERIGGSVWVLGALAMNLGQAQLRQGRADEAAAQLARAEALYAQAQVRDLLPELYGLQAEAHGQRAAWGEAEALARRAQGVAAELKMAREEGVAWRLLGEIALVRGGLAEAAGHFAQSAGQLAAAGDEYEAAKTQLAWARLEARTDPAAAEARAAASAAVFQRLGAAADLRAAEVLRPRGS